VWGSGKLRVSESGSVKKVRRKLRLFGLGYVRVDVRGKFIENCE